MNQQTQKVKISSAKNVFEIIKNILALRDDADSHKEMFYVLGLNALNETLFLDLVTMGTINQCAPTVRECFRYALIKDAVSIIVSHNHPSGTADPSNQDDIFTKKLVEAGKILDIRMLDHIIVGNAFYSYADKGRLC